MFIFMAMAPSDSISTAKKKCKKKRPTWKLHQLILRIFLQIHLISLVESWSILNLEAFSKLKNETRVRRSFSSHSAGCTIPDDDSLRRFIYSRCLLLEHCPVCMMKVVAKTNGGALTSRTEIKSARAPTGFTVIMRRAMSKSWVHSLDLFLSCRLIGV